MKVKIHDISNINKPVIYTATCEDDCRDSVDRSAYQECIKFNEVITIGKVIAEPIN